ncbi:MAG: GtrA family protein [Clostridia bacterium]|nr:GtrA family protein [Clostridia bacterium]
MHLPLLRIFEPFYRAHKEVLLYLFFGVVTTLVSWGLFWLFDYGLRMHELVANALSWILTVFVAFLTNRVWVFDSPTRTVGAFLLQMLRFYLGRVATLLIEEGILYVFITRLGCPDMWVKIAASVVVVVLNYVFSKWLIFRKRKAPRPDDQGTA